MEETIKINNKGVQYFLNNDFEKAKTEYEKALALDPLNSTTLNNMGLLVHQQKNYAQAVEFFTRAISVHPKDTYHLNLANSLVHQKKYKEAEEHYKKCIKLNPGNENAMISLARFYELTNRPGDATKLWERLGHVSSNDFYELEKAKNFVAGAKYEAALSVLQSLPEHYKPALAQFYRGVCHFNLQNYGMAEAAFRKSLSHEPDNYKTRHYLAMNYFARGESFSAIRELDFLIKMNPENVKVKLDKATLYLNMGEYPKAVELIDAVLKIDQKNAKALHYKKLISELKQKKKEDIR